MVSQFCYLLVVVEVAELAQVADGLGLLQQNLQVDRVSKREESGAYLLLKKMYLAGRGLVQKLEKCVYGLQNNLVVVLLFRECVVQRLHQVA